MQYSDFQNQPSSEKITLASMAASKRLMGWELDSGSIYKLSGFTYPVVESIADSGTDYTEVFALVDVTASKYFLDRENQILYIRTTGSDNPNGRFLVAVLKFFFANVPIILPHDLDQGFDVQWEPLIKTTSQFGVEIDTVNQTSEAIEGSGTLTLNNDYDFWPKNFDKLSFDNQPVQLYSYNRELSPQDARLIFKGIISSKSYTKDTVAFNLSDQFAILKSPIPLNLVSDLAARTGEDLAESYQRMIFGKVVGNVPTNIDQVLDTGYPLAGTVSAGSVAQPIGGIDTLFTSELTLTDLVIIGSQEYTIQAIVSDTKLLLTPAARSSSSNVAIRKSNGTVITGTVSGSPASSILTGSGTLFSSELSSSDSLIIAGTKYNISSITDNTHLILSAPPSVTFSAQSAKKVPVDTLTGTVSTETAYTYIVGTGTSFLSELSPNDTILFGPAKFSIATVLSDTVVTISEDNVDNTNLVDQNAFVIPDRAKRTMNRIFKVAGHSLREPLTTISDRSTIEILIVESTRDIYDGDTIYIGELGAGEVAVVHSVVGDHYIKLASTLGFVPESGTLIRRPAVQNVRIDAVRLIYDRDYSFDAETSVLTLRNTAEENAGPTYQLTGNIQFTNGSRNVSGSGFQGIINPGDMIGIVGNAIFFEVNSVNADDSITLKTPATFGGNDVGRYKSFIYDPESSVLTVDVLGMTEDGTTSGTFIKTAPSISKKLLELAGLGDSLNEASFNTANQLAYQEVGLVVPEKFDDSVIPSYRDLMNQVNKSVFGALVQDIEFQFSYQVLRPNKSSAVVKFTESDLLAFTLSSTSENVVKTCTVQYQPREYDYVTKDSSFQIKQNISDDAQYVVGSAREKVIETVLANEQDAEILVARWSFLLQSAASRVTITTKLPGATLEIGNVIEVDHRKFFERQGSASRRKLFIVEAVNRSGTDCKIEATDLSNAFTRVASINDITNNWTDASETERLYGGFYTDQYGLINNDPESFDLNLIW